MVTRQDRQLLPHKMKRQTLFAKVEFRFQVRNPEGPMSGFGAQLLNASTHNRFSSSVVNKFS